MKKQNIYIISRFIIAFMGISLLSGCFLDDHETYKGRILSYGTLEPVSGAVVSIIAGKTVGVLERRKNG